MKKLIFILAGVVIGWFAWDSLVSLFVMWVVTFADTEGVAWGFTWATLVLPFTIVPYFIYKLWKRFKKRGLRLTTH